MPSHAKLQKLATSAPALTGRRAALRAVLLAAALHRRRLQDVVFIGVTGSCGKTTTVSLINGILRQGLRGRKSRGTQNRLTVVAEAVLRTGKTDAFSVIEIAAWEPRSVSRAARTVQPNIGVVTHIGSDHRTTFRTLEATAAEKSDLLANLAQSGTAILNADDPRVMGMAYRFGGRILTFGSSPDAVLRAEDVRSPWPERLSFTLCHDGRSLPVRTRLCGKHWVSSALAALGVASAMGLPLEQAVDALALIEPCLGRMSPVAQDGMVFIRDDVKAPWWTVDAVLEFLAEARARRKVAVFGTLSDMPGSASGKYRAVARRALATADEVLFVGPNASHVRKVAASAGGRLYIFSGVGEAAEHVRANMRQGDLVLLKGSAVDGLDRITAH